MFAEIATKVAGGATQVAVRDARFPEGPDHSTPSSEAIAATVSLWIVT